MGFLKKLFGKLWPGPPAKPKADASKDAEFITVFDAFGREYQITRKDWRESVLPGTLVGARQDPEQLYALLAQSLQDGLFEEVLPFAKHLQTIDPTPSRAATLLGVTYLQLGRLDDAQETFRSYLNQHGEEAYVLTNLAKVYAELGNVTQADATLWRALELDPNQENAVGWYWGNAKERGGEEGGLNALHKLAALPNSWRARVWIARDQLEKQDLAGALQTYDQALAVVERPVPADLLMSMSGELGKHGQLVELLKLVTPLFDSTVHGLLVGNNLIKANVDLGRLDHARGIVDRLYGLQRPDFQPTLSYWDTEIAKARVAAENTDFQTPLSVTMLSARGPIWLAEKSPAARLFPSKSADAVAVCILGASAETGATEMLRQLPDAAGRSARAVTLFLSEQIHLRTTALSQMLQPWLRPGGFVLSGQPCDNEAGIDRAKACQPPGDYIILLHLIATARPFQLAFRLLRCIDGSLLDSASFSLDPDNLEPAFTPLVDRVLASLCRHTDTEPINQPTAYQVPSGPWFNDYQLRLEQASAVRAAAMGDTRRDFLNGEREIIGGMLHLCLSTPASISARIMLLDSLRRMREVCPQVVAEFREKVDLLQKDYPVPEIARPALEGILAEVYP